MYFDAGQLILDDRTIDQIVEDFLTMVMDVASGHMCLSEYFETTSVSGVDSWKTSS